MRLTRSLPLCVAALLCCMVFVSAAAAAPATIPNAVLEQVYQAEIRAAARQQTAIAAARNALKQAEARITELKSAGYDVSALEQAFSSCQEALERATAENQAASDILSHHDGFDAEGTVIDNAAATATLQDAAIHLNAVVRIAQEALAEVHAAIDAFRAANPGVPFPPLPRLQALTTPVVVPWTRPD